VSLFLGGAFASTEDDHEATEYEDCRGVVTQSRWRTSGGNRVPCGAGVGPDLEEIEIAFGL